MMDSLSTRITGEEKTRFSKATLYMCDRLLSALPPFRTYQGFVSQLTIVLCFMPILKSWDSKRHTIEVRALTWSLVYQCKIQFTLSKILAHSDVYVRVIELMISLLSPSLGTGHQHCQTFQIHSCGPPYMHICNHCFQSQRAHILASYCQISPLCSLSFVTQQNNLKSKYR